MLIATGGLVQRDPELLGQGSDPSQHIGQLVNLFLACSLARRSGQFTHLFSQVCHGGRHPAGAITLAVGALHHFLERSEIH